jgi:hypothetical protein
MSKSVIVHDTRLNGTVNRHEVDHVISTNENHTLHNLISHLLHYAQRQGGISRLWIMCHGYEQIYEDNVAQASFQIGGYGLQLTADNLTLANVSSMATLRDHIDNIVLFACSPADTHPGTQNTAWDGRRFCSEMAAWTDANVYASSSPQTYMPHHLNFGAWEGKVYQFSPTGAIQVVEENPL